MGHRGCFGGFAKKGTSASLATPDLGCFDVSQLLGVFGIDPSSFKALRTLERHGISFRAQVP